MGRGRGRGPTISVDVDTVEVNLYDVLENSDMREVLEFYVEEEGKSKDDILEACDIEMDDAFEYGAENVDGQEIVEWFLDNGHLNLFDVALALRKRIQDGDGDELVTFMRVLLAESEAAPTPAANGAPVPVCNVCGQPTTTNPCWCGAPVPVLGKEVGVET